MVLSHQCHKMITQSSNLKVLMFLFQHLLLILESMLVFHLLQAHSNQINKNIHLYRNHLPNIVLDQKFPLLQEIKVGGLNKSFQVLCQFSTN